MDEVYLVMPRRRDGTMPKACKAIADRLFYTVEDANNYMGRFYPDEKANWGIFRAVIEVKEEIKF